MQPIDFFTATDASAADVLHLRERVEQLARTVEEQAHTIELLQTENRSARILELLDVREVRRQLSESEQMRNNLSDELQRIRAKLAACIILANGAIREELNALAELSELGYLNLTGHARMDELRTWLEQFNELG